MIEIKILETDYKVRTSWNEVTLKEYCEIVKAQSKDWIERLSIYSGIPLDIINKIKLKQLQILLDLVEFMDEPDIVQAFVIGYESEMKIGEQPYWKIEKCKQLLKDNPFPITVGAEIVELYTGDVDGNGGEKISDKPVTEVIGMCAYYLDQIDKFFTRFKRLNDYKPTDDEIESGIDKLNIVATTLTTVKLAARTNKSTDEVLKSPAEEMYFHLLADFEVSEFEKRMRQTQEENAALQRLANKR